MPNPAAGDTFLGRLTNNDVVAIRDMDSDEVAQLQEATSIVRAFHRESQSYEHARRDYDDLVSYTDGIRRLIIEHGTSPDLALDVEVEINRRIMALLSSFKAFLDHARHALSRRFGDQSDELATFDRACSAEYDSEFPYRLATRLRNYAQHRDLPVGYMVLRSPAKYRDTPAAISMVCVRDQLLASGFEWKGFKSELQAQPDNWNLYTTIEQLMPCLARVRAAAVRPVIAGVLSASKRITALARETGSLQFQPVIVRIVDHSAAATRLQMTLIAHHHAAQILDEHASGEPAD